VVTLRLFAGLRQLVGKRELKLPSDGITIKRLLEDFAERHGEEARRFLFNREGELWQSLLLLVNDDLVDRKGEVVVKAGDVVSILLPTAGG
jgi:MoaD family protein